MEEDDECVPPRTQAQELSIALKATPSPLNKACTFVFVQLPSCMSFTFILPLMILRRIPKRDSWHWVGALGIPQYDGAGKLRAFLFSFIV